MKKKSTTPDPITIISCGGPSDLRDVLCCSCHASVAKLWCAYQLGGRKAGSTCGRPVCLGCSRDGRCLPHAPQERRWDPTVGGRTGVTRSRAAVELEEARAIEAARVLAVQGEGDDPGTDEIGDAEDAYAEGSL